MLKKLVSTLLLTTLPCLAQNVTADAWAKSKSEAQSGLTREQGDAILLELKAIHQLLERQQAPAQAQAQPPQKVKVSVKIDSGWQTIGRDDAPVTIIEFADYQCPYCRKFHKDTFAELKKNYIDSGKVRFVSRDLPLQFHPNASGAALAARCAADQNKFWEMRDLLLGSSADLAPESITKFGEQLKLDMGIFQSCMSAKKYSADIQKDVAVAGGLGVNATPSFVIGKTAKDKIDGVRLAGALTYSSMESLIQDQLRPQSPSEGGN